MHLCLLCTHYMTSRSPSIFSQFSPKFSFLGKMKPGKNSSPNVNYAVLRENVGTDAPSVMTCTTDPAYEEICPSLSSTITPGSKGEKRTRADLRPHLEQLSNGGAGDFGIFQLESSPMEGFTSRHDESSLPSCFGKKRVSYPNRVRKKHQNYSANLVGSRSSDRAEGLLPVEPFDICLSGSPKSFILNSWLIEKNRDKLIKKTRQILRSGMVLLPNYISLKEQVEIVQKCRELGLGPGGFYQPGYQDGAKLRLQMMCLGRNWDPQTLKYEERRQSDGARPPGIPPQLISLVKKALQDSLALIKGHNGASNVEDIIPGMSPDICIINFYKTSGRLGLHQDRDESQESLRRRLPVVSFSVGDTAEFLYGDKRDVDKAEKILLESGDVLIFGGKSRHIFHGVKSIIPNSAPPPLLKETMLQPGRLNLTFRQH